MSKVIVVGFDTEEQAREAEGVLHEMHSEGPITLYNEAIVVKEPDGKVAVRRQPKTPRVGTAGGLVTGGLLGLLAGPAGAAVGLGVGALAGAAVDAAENDIAKYFVADAGAQLESGKAALVAEIDEDSEGPLDRRMEEIAGRPLRRTRTLLGDASFDQLTKSLERNWRAWRPSSLRPFRRRRPRRPGRRPADCKRRSTRRRERCGRRTKTSRRSCSW